MIRQNASWQKGVEEVATHVKAIRKQGDERGCNKTKLSDGVPIDSIP